MKIQTKNASLVVALSDEQIQEDINDIINDETMTFKQKRELLDKKAAENIDNKEDYHENSD